MYLLTETQDQPEMKGGRRIL